MGENGEKIINPLYFENLTVWCLESIVFLRSAPFFFKKKKRSFEVKRIFSDRVV